MPFPGEFILGALIPPPRPFKPFESEGGVNEKIQAAIELGIDTILITRPALALPDVYTSIADILNKVKALR